MPYRNKETRNESFDFGRRDILQEELGADMYGSGEIDFDGMFSLLMLNDYVRGNQLGKVIHSQLGKDLLENELRLF